jgi:glycosyltransferase involved in cell wall biosynthesis
MLHRILYITASLPYSEAAEEFFIPEINSLRDRGFDILLLPRSPNGMILDQQCRALLAASFVRPLLSGDIALGALITAFTHPLKAAAAILEILLCSGIRNILQNMAVLPKALWAAGQCRVRRIDHVHAQWANTTATMGLIIHRITGIPWSFTAHRGDIVQRNMLVRKAGAASFMRCISASGAEKAGRSTGGAGTENVCVIHMGVSIPSPSPPVSNRRVMCPASLLPVKGHRFLFQAVALLRQRGIDCAVDLAGEGPELRDLQTLVSSLAIADRVTFLGRVSHPELLRRYADGQVRVVVLPSVDLGHGLHEGIPVGLMEAMSYGIPVISTRTGGIPELLDGGAGVLVPPCDGVALAGAIEEVLTDDVRWQVLSQAGRTRVEAEFNVDLVASSLAERIKGAIATDVHASIDHRLRDGECRLHPEHADAPRR